MSQPDEGTRRRLAKNVRKQLQETEAQLAARRWIGRCYRLCFVVLAAGLLTFGIATSAGWRNAIVRKIDLVSITLVIIFGGATSALGIWDRRSSLPSRVKIEVELDDLREQARWVEASNSAKHTVSQRLYKADIPSYVEQYQRDGDRYRTVHNRLQSAVIVGSLSTTTVASLGNALPDSRWLTVGLSFVVGLAAGFMGYFKFRERSFYLQQTADAIEHEDNAMTLRIGDYRELKDDDALALLVERVERLRNEQRRRQQQLDQPVEGQAPGSLTNGQAE